MSFLSTNLMEKKVCDIRTYVLTNGNFKCGDKSAFGN